MRRVYWPTSWYRSSFFVFRGTGRLFLVRDLVLKRNREGDQAGNIWNQIPTISLGSHQNIGLHTGARANVVLLTYLLKYVDKR